MANLTYLHPSIVSSVESEESTYQVADGVTTLFVADTFEKGEDNKVKLVTSVDEFLFKYGEPNYAKYGQAAYNVLRWLENKGQAFVLRVLPENAKYSHAILNIQTKKVDSGKAVKDANGNLINIDNVFIRPIISYLESNCTDLESLKYEVSKERIDDQTIDGYFNNFLMAVYPTGRGSAYNNLGFRISLNSSYDNISESRVYNFEVIRFDEYYNASVVEGPFYVSFDPDALTSSNESMYIENVVNRYSEVLRVTFNPDVWEKVAGIINPNEDPRSIDILTGKSRVLVDGKVQTYYDTKVGIDLDVHVTLQKYSSLGEVVLSNGDYVLNIPSYDDIVEQSIISLDNGIRKDNTDTTKNKLMFMKEQYPKLGSESYANYITEIHNLIKDSISQITESSEHRDNYDAAIEGYTGTEESYSEVIAADSHINLDIENLLNEINKINASEQLVNDESDLDYVTLQEQIFNTISDKEKIHTMAIATKSNVTDISSIILQFKLGNYEGNLYDELNYIMSLIGDEMDYTYFNILTAVYGEDIDPEISQEFIGKDSSGNIVETSKAFIFDKTVKDIYDMSVGYTDPKDAIATDEPLLDKDGNEVFDSEGNKLYVMTTRLDIVYSNMNDIIDFLSEVLTQSVVDNIVNHNTSNFEKIQGLEEITNSIVNTEILSVINTKEKDELIEDGRNSIDKFTTTVATSNSELYNNNLQNFSNPIKLTMGSDGDFEYGVLSTRDRNIAIKNELIRAYKGEIDIDVTNKKLVEFDHILDCNYDVDVKNAIVSLARDIRGDFFYWADTNIQANPEEVIKWRRESFNVSSRHVGIFSQDMTFYDAYTGKDIKFTTPYILSQKIPYNALNYGLHYPIAGPRRGLVDGFKSLCWSPNEAYKEQLYNNKVNYIEQDSKRTKIGSQLTTDSKNGPLSNINNVLTILKMQRNVEKICEEYQFEFNDDETRNALYYELNDYLSTYITNRSCETVSVEVTASDYDMQQKILRVNISVKFYNVIERIVISFSVQK